MIPRYSQGYPPDTGRQQLGTSQHLNGTAVPGGGVVGGGGGLIPSFHQEYRSNNAQISQRYAVPQRSQGVEQPAPPVRMQIQGQGQGFNNLGGASEQGGQAADAQSNAASGAAGPPEMNLANVLHYLQSEWRRWERDRNEWEIERAEMRARIALLEGQRRSAENLKVDLLRRVKMLEYALRQERTKSVNTASKSGIAPSRLAALQDEDRASSKDEKEGSVSEGSEGSAERADISKLNGVHPAAMGGRNSAVSVRGQDSMWSKISAVPRDPKSRARSREYLKQCLQEVSYLTSPGALNPLPPDAPVSLDRPASPASEAGGYPIAGESSKAPERPRKTLPDNPPASILARPSTIPEEEAKPLTTGAESRPPATTAPDSAQLNGWESVKAAASGHLGNQTEESSRDPKPPSVAQHLSSKRERPPSSPMPISVGLPEEPDNSNKGVLTAIYKPESKAAWRAELRAANTNAQKIQTHAKAALGPTDSLGDELANLSLNAEAEGASEAGEDKIWATSRILSCHLDVVRAVDFSPGRSPVLASGSDDMTVKVWSLDVPSLLATSGKVSEHEPIITFRGHTAPVVAVKISAADNAIFSASMDSTIRVWRLPARGQDPYAPWESSWHVQTLEGHTDAVWDICVLTGVNGESSDGPSNLGAPLLSASADGTVKYWAFKPDANAAATASHATIAPHRRGSKGAWPKRVNGDEYGDKALPSASGPSGTWALEASWSFDGATPTCLARLSSDVKQVLVGLSDGYIVQWDAKTGTEKRRFGPPEGSTPSTVNAVLSYMVDYIAAATEDGCLHFYDTRTTSRDPYHSCRGHPSAITSLALSPISPWQMISASADCSLRVWDLDKKQALQDLQGHRDRAGEGITAVAAHGDLPIIASAGSDGAVRLWTK